MIDNRAITNKLCMRIHTSKVYGFDMARCVVKDVTKPSLPGVVTNGFSMQAIDN